MQNIKPEHFDATFVPTGCPTFADLLANLAAENDFFPNRLRDMASGLRRVASALNRPPEDVFCDTRWLQTRIRKIEAAQLGLSKKSWQNAVSDARAAMVRYGIVKRKNNSIKDLSPAWRELWEQVTASGDIGMASGMRRFVFFLNRFGIAPADVTGQDALDYKSAIELQEISRSPEVAYRAAANAWNRASKHISDWPKIVLVLPNRQKIIQLPEGVLPASFNVDLDKFLNFLAVADPFTDDAPTKALRPTSILHYRRLILRFAAEAVNSGTAPHTLLDLTAMTEPGVVERTLRYMLFANGQKSSPSISQTTRLLGRIATWLNVSEDNHRQLVKLAKKVSVPHYTSMTPKNRSRLRALQNDTNLFRLLDLPDRLFTAKTIKTKGHPRALAREDALAIAILQYCPIRAQNLSHIHLEQNIQRPGDGRAYLVFEDDEVRNSRPLEFEIPRDVVKMMDAHLQTRCPMLCPPGTPWLFPKRDGSRAINATELAARISKRILKETGLEVNAHLFRHLAVMLHLDSNPGAYEAATRLLGHSHTGRTIRVYSGMETRSATKAFSDLVTAKKSGKR
jgi:integrase